MVNKVLTRACLAIACVTLFANTCVGSNDIDAVGVYITLIGTRVTLVLVCGITLDG